MRLPRMVNDLRPDRDSNVASRRSGWPDMGSRRSENGWMWTDAAWCLWSLAPRLAPRKIVSRANVRASRAHMQA